MPRHGEELNRSIPNTPHSSLPSGRFGRLFPMLGEFSPPDGLLFDLAKAGGPMEDNGKPGGDNKPVPAGFTYLGQFIDHDLTFDPVSSITKKIDPDSLHNFRSPRFDLDSVYGFGHGASPHLYNRKDPDKLLTVKTKSTKELDLPRNSQETALVGDPRNDENILVSQMQVAFLHFHNAVVEHLRAKKASLDKHKLPGESLFETAQRLVRWHYQWIVVHDFLPRICGQAVVDSLLSINAQGKHTITNVLYQPTNNPFIPIEFAVAAYRFGHSMVRQDYRLNDEIFASIFGKANQPLSHLGGARILPDFWQIKWPFFFKFPGRGEPQASRKIDAKLAAPLLKLPATVIGQKEFDEHPDRRSLAVRNLLRGKRLGVPSGQAVAVEMGETPLTNAELGLSGAGWGGEAPLWFYVLKESEKAPSSGKRLGPVGGRIVAEVLLGVLNEDESSFVNHSAVFKPVKPLAPKAGDFAMHDLIKFADVIQGGSSPGD
ncbi:MAG: peroxidase family protein [Actinomycetota bacterium]